MTKGCHTVLNLNGGSENRLFSSAFLHAKRTNPSHAEVFHSRGEAIGQENCPIFGQRVLQKCHAC
jgi:hypothetical protein